MHAIVKVVPGGGWAAQVQLGPNDERTEVLEEWLREEVQRVVKFQNTRGGGLFLLCVPEDVAQQT